MLILLPTLKANPASAACIHMRPSQPEITYKQAFKNFNVHEENLLNRIVDFINFFALSVNAQLTCPVNTTALNVAETNGKCQVNVFTSSTFVGAVLTAYAGSENITISQTGIVQSSNPANGYGIVFYDCSRFEEVTRVTMTKDGVTCEAEINANINLPIKLDVFSATLKSGTAVQLDWSTLLESNSAKFNVEKSADGKSFTTIGSVKAAGNSASLLKYTFEDRSFAGTAYYRLHMIDLDGKAEYSEVRYVNGGPNASTTFSVFPNPFRSDVQLKGINASDVNKSNIRVFSATGKEVSYKVTGANSIAIDASLPKGIYILRVKEQTYKLVKE